MKKILLLVLLIAGLSSVSATANRVPVGTIVRDGQTIVSVQVNPAGDIDITMFDAHVRFLAGRTANLERVIAKGLELIQAVTTNNITVEYSRSLGTLPLAYSGSRMSFIFTANRVADNPPVLYGYISSSATSRYQQTRWSLYEKELVELQQLIARAKELQEDLSGDISLLNKLLENWSIF